jgi:copper chaperone NosL
METQSHTVYGDAGPVARPARPLAMVHRLDSMPGVARLLTAIAAVALTGLFFVPLWSIQLVAPQYPEGLGMRIGISDVRGATPTDLDNINGLNHYIGMKHITPSAIPELRYMPWIVAGLVLLGLLAAVIGRRKLLIGWLSTFLVAGAAGLVDFWRWEHDYGHNIDFSHAIIKIPGMTYQPPLIGVKQLLNFTAVSWPDTGAWLALGAFALAIIALVVTHGAQCMNASPDRRG